MSLANYWTALASFKPEGVLCASILLMLLLGLSGLSKRVPGFVIALAGSCLATLFAGEHLLVLLSSRDGIGEAFGGMLSVDCLGGCIRAMLSLFLVLFVSLTVLTCVPAREESVEFYTMVFGATLGMMVLCQANNLLMLFIGVEMASIPCYCLVGFMKGSRKSSEAAVKYVIYGAGASGAMLFGISVVAGVCGGGEYSSLGAALASLGQGHEQASLALIRSAVLGVTLVFVGFAFKLSIVPFHFWCPDAFEGATAEVGAYLSVASKIAAFGALLRFVLVVCGDSGGRMSASLGVLALGMSVIAAITVCFGNLAAYSQRDIRRMLAYSTIAHAGYMLLGVASLFVSLTVGRSVEGFDSITSAVAAVQGVLFYLFCYLFMNLGAFGVLAILRSHVFGQSIDDLDGVGLEAPTVGVSMCVCLFGLVGLPPLGGFVGKFAIFATAFGVGSAHWLLYPVLVVAALNVAVSLVFYIRVLRGLFLRPRSANALPVRVSSASGNYALLIALPVIVLGVFPHYASNLALRVSESLLR